MSASSSVLFFRRSLLVQLLILAFILSCGFIATADRPIPDMAFERFAVQNNDYSSKLSPNSLVDVLKKRGILRIIQNIVPEFHDLLEKMEHLFHFMEKDRHAHDLNKLLGHFKNTWSRALDEVMREDGRSPSDEVDVNAFHAFIEKYQFLLDSIIRSDRGLEGSDVVQFLSQLEHLFRALESAYAVLFLGLQGLQLPVQLNWFLFSQTKLIINSLPSNLFDPDMLGDLMRTPREMVSQFSQTFDELFEALEGSPAGAYLPLLINMIQTVSEKQRHNVNRGEL